MNFAFSIQVAVPRILVSRDSDNGWIECEQRTNYSFPGYKDTCCASPPPPLQKYEFVIKTTNACIVISDEQTLEKLDQNFHK